MRLATAMLLLLTACSTAESPAAATCERRQACGNLGGESVAACTTREEAYLTTLGADRDACEAAWDECLGGAICDDFRSCHAMITAATCGCPDVRLAILDPVDGQMVTAADDVDPSDSQIQYDVLVEASCLAELEQVELFILEPVESSFGFGTPDTAGRATIRVPLIPGPNRFVARGTTTTVESAEISITVSP